MAILQNPHFHILRDTLEVGSICEIHYRYELICEKRELELGIQFHCWVVLCGVGMMHDNALGQSQYDKHTQSPQHLETQYKRSFIVPCEILNEAIGLDEIYLDIVAHGSNGAKLIAQTPIIKEHF